MRASALSRRTIATTRASCSADTSSCLLTRITAPTHPAPHGRLKSTRPTLGAQPCIAIHASARVDARRTISKLDLVNEQVGDGAGVGGRGLPLPLAQRRDRVQLGEKVVLHMTRDWSVRAQRAQRPRASLRSNHDAVQGTRRERGGGTARTASTTVTSVSSRHSVSRRLPAASSNVNVSATGMGSEIPNHHAHTAQAVCQPQRQRRAHAQ
jgi:hypothetical protein